MESNQKGRFKIVTPMEFRDAFIEIVQREENQLFNLWRKVTEYTSFMLGTNSKDDLLRQVAGKLSLKYYKEYWHLDAIFYDRLDKKHFEQPNATYAEYICVALEHENAITRSCEEMNKLSVFNAPLKILITYPPSKSEEEKYLSEYRAILQQSAIFNDFSTSRKQLVVFGYKNNSIAWNFYLYNRTKFEPI